MPAAAAAATVWTFGCRKSDCSERMKCASRANFLLAENERTNEKANLCARTSPACVLLCARRPCSTHRLSHAHRWAADGSQRIRRAANSLPIPAVVMQVQILHERGPPDAAPPPPISESTFGDGAETRPGWLMRTPFAWAPQQKLNTHRGTQYSGADRLVGPAPGPTTSTSDTLTGNWRPLSPVSVYYSSDFPKLT